MENLIFDRTQADVTYAAELNRKLNSGEALTAQELADWNAGLKGAYNATDMNRVDAAVREIGAKLTAAGYPVRYTNPKAETPSGNNGDLVLTADDLQPGVWLGVSGEYSNLANYVCTKEMIRVEPGISVVVHTDLEFEQTPGFIWYDASKKYIINTTLNVGKLTLWGNLYFQASPPANAAYCHINIYKTGITPQMVAPVTFRQEHNPETASLPDGYQRVEYIESSGNEYIDTGFKPDSNTRVICEFMPLDSTKAYGIFGSRTAYRSSAYNLFAHGTGIYFQDDYNNTGTASIETVANTLYVIDKNKNVSTMNGTQYSVAYSSFEVEYSMYLFGVNTSGNVNSAQLGALRMYSCTIYDNDILVRYYIPCTSSTGAVGLYDTVSGSFFGNANASSVEPVDLPSGYTQVEYIQSSGTQYINTGYKPNQDSRVVLDFEMTDTSEYAQGLFGSRNESPATASLAFDAWISGNTNIRTNYFGLVTTLTNIQPLGNRRIIDKNKNVVTIAGQTYTFASRSGQCPRDMYLLAINQGTAEYKTYCKVYSCVVYASNTVVRNFIPCRNSSGAVGLYDIANSKFYSNAGSGTFLAGAEVSSGFSAGMPMPEPAPPPDENAWQIGDVVKQSEWAQYIANVQSLRDAYYTMPDTPKLPAPTAPLNFDGANAIEKLIYDILKLYKGMVYRYRICGTFTAGNNYNRQYIRSV